MIDWQTARYNDLCTLRVLTESLWGSKTPDHILQMLDRLAAIQSEPEFERFMNFANDAFKVAFEKVGMFEAA